VQFVHSGFAGQAVGQSSQYSVYATGDSVRTALGAHTTSYAMSLGKL